jgi:hypothetical protein
MSIDEKIYLKWCDYILKSYAPMYGELILEAKWELLKKYQKGNE